MPGIVPGIASALHELRRLMSAEPRPYYGDATVASEVLPPVTFDPAHIERAIGGKLPPDVDELYRSTGGMDLFKDVGGPLFGFEVFSPRDVVVRGESVQRRLRRRHVRRADGRAQQMADRRALGVRLARAHRGAPRTPVLGWILRPRPPPRLMRAAR